MALQDLTPQLRTRLSRLERVVGIFVAFATVLLVAGLAYYIYRRAQSKGWGRVKLPYYTYVHSGAGLKVGDPIQLMGRDIGHITHIEPMPPGDPNDVFVGFYVTEPDYGYLWDDSRAKVASSDFLGKRTIEVTKGTNGPATYIFNPVKDYSLDDAAGLAETNRFYFAEEIYGQNKTDLVMPLKAPFTKSNLALIVEARSVASIRLFDASETKKRATGLWNPQEARYVSPNESETTRKGFFLVPDESPALNERLEAVAAQVERMVGVVETALPNVLDLTNQLARVLDNAANAAARADDLLDDAKPIVANLTRITENISDPNGSLGEWLIPPNLSLQITQALASANSILTNSDAQITTLAEGLDQTIENLAGITGELRKQVQANPNVVSEVSKLIIDTDDMVQGLKRHWLLRSAFKKKPAEKERKK